MYNLNYLSIYHPPVYDYYVWINDFDYNITGNYLAWLHGKNKVRKILLKNFDNMKSGPSKSLNFYETIMPSLFFKSVSIHNDMFGINMFSPSNIVYDLISIFDEEHFEKLFNYWNSIYKDTSLHKNLIDHLKQNYKKYINEAVIKDIIE